MLRSDDVHHTLQVADSIFKSKTRSLLFRPLDRRSPNEEYTDTIHVFFFQQDSVLHTLSPSCNFGSLPENQLFCQGCRRDCHCRTGLWLVIKDGAAQGAADFSVGLSFGMDLPKTITTLQRDCSTKTRAPHCQVMIRSGCSVYVGTFILSYIHLLFSPVTIDGSNCNCESGKAIWKDSMQITWHMRIPSFSIRLW